MAAPGGKVGDQDDRPATPTALTAEDRVAIAEYERDLALWRLASHEHRRSWQAWQALLAARSSVRRFLRLPVTLLRILRSPSPALPRPTAPPAVTRPRPPSPVPAIERARAAAERGDHDGVLVATDEACEIAPDDVRALDLRWQALDALGEPAAALDVLRHQRRVQDRTRLAAAERRLLGEQLVLQSAWFPAVAAATHDPAGPVLLLGTADDRDLVSAVTASGAVGAARVLRPLFPLDIDADVPPDVAAGAIAWWAARSAREEPPAAVAAELGADLVAAVAAAALARASGCRLLLLDDGAPTATSSSRDRARAHRRSMLLASADQVAAPRTVGTDEPSDRSH